MPAVPLAHGDILGGRAGVVGADGSDDANAKEVPLSGGENCIGAFGSKAWAQPKSEIRSVPLLKTRRLAGCAWRERAEIEHNDRERIVTCTFEALEKRKTNEEKRKESKQII